MGLAQKSQERKLEGESKQGEPSERSQQGSQGHASRCGQQRPLHPAPGSSAPQARLQGLSIPLATGGQERHF